MTAVVLGLVAAIGYGAADFSAGLASRRLHILSVAMIVNAVAVLMFALVLPFVGSPPSGSALLWGGLSGLAFGAGSIVYFRGLAKGHMGLVATMCAVFSAMVPVVVALAGGERPSLTALLGMGLAIIAIGLIAGGADFASLIANLARPQGAGLWEGTLGGAMYGLFFIFISRAEAGSALWPVFAATGVSALTIAGLVLWRGHCVRVPVNLWSLVVLAGFFQVVATLALVLATRQGLLSLVVVVVALSPAPTMLLARIMLRETVSWLQLLGVGIGLTGVALMSSG